MDSFQGSGYITLQPGDTSVPVDFRFKPCSASTINDGSIPYGSTMKSITWVKANKDNSTAQSTAMIASVSLSSNRVRAYLTYSSAINPGLYNLTLKVKVNLSGTTIDMTKQYDFKRVYVGDRR